ncbi:MAG: hypothetical protein MPJ24_11200 [Pirellulaceae bacterium]|nr:hypothetical protein [Pirellulaceae bacterium]
MTDDKLLDGNQFLASLNNPNYSKAIQAGQDCYQQRDYEGSLYHFQKALEATEDTLGDLYEPSIFFAFERIAFSYFQMQNYHMASIYFVTVQSRYPFWYYSYQLAICFFELEKLHESNYWLNKTLDQEKIEHLPVFISEERNNVDWKNERANLKAMCEESWKMQLSFAFHEEEGVQAHEMVGGKASLCAEKDKGDIEHPIYGRLKGYATLPLYQQLFEWEKEGRIILPWPTPEMDEIKILKPIYTRENPRLNNFIRVARLERYQEENNHDRFPFDSNDPEYGDAIRAGESCYLRGEYLEGILFFEKSLLAASGNILVQKYNLYDVLSLERIAYGYFQMKNYHMAFCYYTAASAHCEYWHFLYQALQCSLELGLVSTGGRCIATAYNFFYRPDCVPSYMTERLGFDLKEEEKGFRNACEECWKREFSFHYHQGTKITFGTLAFRLRTDVLEENLEKHHLVIALRRWDKEGYLQLPEPLLFSISDEITILKPFHSKESKVMQKMDVVYNAMQK